MNRRRQPERPWQSVEITLPAISPLADQLHDDLLGAAERLDTILGEQWITVVTNEEIVWPPASRFAPGEGPVEVDEMMIRFRLQRITEDDP